MTDSDKRKEFTLSYSDYYPIVFSAIYSKIGNKEDARDICQEVFLRFYKKCDEVNNIRKWLFIALRLVIMEYYRAKKGEDISIDEVFNDVSLTFVNGFRDTRIIISDAIENIENFKDEKDKLIFEMIAVHNFTYNYAATQIGMTRRQVEYKYNQIVKRITDYLKKKGIESIEDLL